MEYTEFLKQKQKTHIESGFDIDESELNPKLFDFQKFIVKRALKAGKYALFEDCGLGKTIQQLEWAQQIINRELKPVLILAPLAVGDESKWEPITSLNKQNFALDMAEMGSPVWHDIMRTDVLSNYKKANDDKDEKHICPLQLEVIKRCIWLWSNPGETVFTPYAGIGSEPFVSVQEGRKAVAIELKEEYYDMMVKNMRNVVDLQKQWQLIF